MLRILLSPISIVVYIILLIRHKLYDWKIFKSEKFDRPVVCVGNLNLGGTGKTPHVEYLLQLLVDRYQVCTISHGYGRETQGFKSATNGTNARDIGDEPMLFYSKYGDKAWVVADRDRNEAIRIMTGRYEELHPNKKDNRLVFLLDDAFQHRSTEAGLNILLTRYDRLYTRDFLFPSGTLRDLGRAARRAHIVVVTKCPQLASVDESMVKALRKELKLRDDQHLYISAMEHEPLKPVNQTAQATTQQLRSVSAKSVGVLCFTGIDNPFPLHDHLRETYRELHKISFADHHSFSEKDIRRILECYDQIRCDDKIIVTTEKDYARLINNPYLCEFEKAPLFVAPIKVKFHEEEKFKEEILNYVQQNTSNG